MTIYVDPLVIIPTRNPEAMIVGERHQHQWCRLYAFPVTPENTEALHKLAKSIGLKRQWYQMSPSSFPHYSIVPTKRKQAIKHGAEEVTGKEATKHSKAYRIATRPLSAVQRFYLHAQLLAESLFLKAPGDSTITLIYPTPETMHLETKPIPEVWTLGIEYEGNWHYCSINTKELAIAITEAKLEEFAATITADLAQHLEAKKEDAPSL